jgi:2-polyprenyl-3-methyl-5-hydroxy-6-metoxy-1,4-benzoquinol methylase
MVVAMANNGMPYSAPPPQPPINSSLPPVNLATQNGAPQDYYENDRLYHGYRKGKYLFPCDEGEKDRLDIYHRFFAVARKEKLHSAPITPNYDLRILDLGTGTGIWAIDMADKYFNDRAEVTGLDLVNIQPRQ